MKLKLKLNKLQKLLPVFIQKNKQKPDLSKTWEAIRSIVNVGQKCKYIPCSLKHSRALLFNPVKVEINIAKRIPKGNKSPMTYLKVEIDNYFYFYPTNLDKIIKIVKSFFNNKSSSSNTNQHL